MAEKKRKRDKEGEGSVREGKKSSVPKPSKRDKDEGSEENEGSEESKGSEGSEESKESKESKGSEGSEESDESEESEESSATVRASKRKKEESEEGESEEGNTTVKEKKRRRKRYKDDGSDEESSDSKSGSQWTIKILTDRDSKSNSQWTVKILTDNDSKSDSQWTEEILLYGFFFQYFDFEDIFTEEERAQELTADLQELKKTWAAVAGKRFKDQNAIAKCSKNVGFFWDHLREVANHPGQEQLVNDFVVQALNCADIGLPGSIVVHQKGDFELTMANQKRYAKPDVYVTDWLALTHTFLLVHEDKSKDNTKDQPFAQVVAEAIAAFQFEQNNRLRERQSLLSHFPILLGVCRGASPCIWFMRALIPWKVARAVANGDTVKEVGTCRLDIQIYPSRETGLNFLNQEDFNEILQCLSCWKYAIHHGAANLKQYEDPNLMWNS